MEIFFSNLFLDYLQHSHWIVFFLLVLSGFYIPISEELVIIVSAYLAAIYTPENSLKLFLFVLSGCYIADQTAYLLARFIGKKLLRFKFFQKEILQKKILTITAHYAKHGKKTLFLARMLPFGVRTCLFFSAGITKVPYKKFASIDFISCFTTVFLLFWSTYYLGSSPTSTYRRLIWVYLGIILFIAAIFLKYYFSYKKNKK